MKVALGGQLALLALLALRDADVEIVEVNTISLRSDPPPIDTIGWNIKEPHMRRYGPQKKRKGKVVKW